MARVYRRECDDARALASAALDGELSEFERASLDAHLRTCAECASVREGMAGVTALVRVAAPEQPAAALWQRPRRRSRRLGRVSAAVGALAAASAMGAVVAGSLGGTAAPRSPAGTLLVAQRPGLAREFRAIRNQPQPFHRAGHRWPRTQFLA
jgi:predicted anti-sigma-YlaC factor YlaD